jgi:hypothetical protein
MRVFEAIVLSTGPGAVIREAHEPTKCDEPLQRLARLRFSPPAPFAQK